MEERHPSSNHLHHLSSTWEPGPPPAQRCERLEGIVPQVDQNVSSKTYSVLQARKALLLEHHNREANTGHRWASRKLKEVYDDSIHRNRLECKEA